MQQVEDGAGKFIGKRRGMGVCVGRERERAVAANVVILFL